MKAAGEGAASGAQDELKRLSAEIERGKSPTAKGRAVCFSRSEDQSRLESPLSLLSFSRFNFLSPGIKTDVAPSHGPHSNYLSGEKFWILRAFEVRFDKYLLPLTRCRVTLLAFRSLLYLKVIPSEPSLPQQSFFKRVMQGFFNSWSFLLWFYVIFLVMFLHLFIYIQILIKVVQSISDNVIIEMPSFVQEGGDTRLKCYFEHVLDGKPLYQLQWQFNGKEFYRFNGKYSPTLQKFTIPGAFEVDVSIWHA